MDKKKFKEIQKFSPFKILELQLQLQEIEKKWEEAKIDYNKKKSVENVDEILKFTVEKIKILAELSYYTYEA